MLHCPVGDKVFIGGEGHSIVVLDGQTSAKVARIPVDGDVTSLCYNPPMNRVYAVCSEALVAIDAASCRVVGVAALGNWAAELCYNPTTNRVYAVAYDRVAVMDCTSDSVVATIVLPSQSEDICCNPARNKVYCVMWSDDVAVIDCATDSIVKTFYTGAGDYDMVYNPSNDHLYISENADDDVAVIDCARDSVLRYLPAGYRPDTMCLSTVSNKLYVPDRDDRYMYVIPCGYDTTFSWFDVGACQTCLAYDSVDDLLYFGTEGTDSLTALSCPADSVIGKVALPFRPEVMGYNPLDNRLYAGGRGNVAVLSGGTGQLLATVNMWYAPWNLAYRAPDNKLYCWDFSGDQLAIVDALSGLVLRWRTLDPAVRCVKYIAGTDRLYCGINSYYDDSTLYIVRCATDSVRSVSGVGGYLVDFCYNPHGDKVYCAGGGWYDSLAVVVLDGTTDSILRRIEVGAPALALELNPDRNKLYAATQDQPELVVIDAGADTVAGRTHVPMLPMGMLYVARESLVCCYGNNVDEIVFLDGTSNQIVTVTPVKGTPDHVIYSPVGNKLYVGCEETDTVSVIDMATLNVAALIPVSSPTYALEFDSAANRVYCRGVSSEHLVTVIDGRRDTVVGVVQTLPWPGPTAWAQPLRRLLVAHPDFAAITAITDTSHVGVLDAGAGARGPEGATIIRGVLFLGVENRGQSLGAPASDSARDSPRFPKPALLDISGRKAMDLKPGPNDVGRLAAGVYFVLEHSVVSSQHSGTVDGARNTVHVRKVIIQR